MILGLFQEKAEEEAADDETMKIKLP